MGGLLSVLDVRNWRVRTRLVALILVPTVAVVLIGGYQIASAMSAAEEFLDRADALATAASEGPWRIEYLLGQGNDLLYALLTPGAVVVGSTLAPADARFIAAARSSSRPCPPSCCLAP